MAAALQAHAVVVPVYRGQRGHPVSFAATCGPALLKLQGSQGATAVLRAAGATEFIVTDLGCVTDIDTVGDLQVAAGLLQHR